MRKHEKSNPMNAQDVLNQYFLENRARLLDIAAFLDRLDRSADKGKSVDFRIDAFRDGIRLLTKASANRVERLQKLLSDPRFEPQKKPEGKTAAGAFDWKKVEE